MAGPMRADDEFDSVDVDAPIPYVITARGLRDLQEWRDEERFSDCQHVWRMNRGALECANCPIVKPLPRGGSVPGYLAPKPGERR